MGKNKPLQQLCKFLSYILGRRPDEFGLVQDQNGFVSVKELLKAINEEEGWGYVRKATLSELLSVIPQPPVEIVDNLIRATCRDLLPQIEPAKNLPRLLYTSVSQKSYPAVNERGVFSTAHPWVILSSSQELAERLGKRRDQRPILLTVTTSKAMEAAVTFFQFGELLLLSGELPVGCFSGPLLPKQKQETKRKPSQSEPKKQNMAGGFEVDLTREQVTGGHSKNKKGKDLSWKRDKKRIRRDSEKHKNWNGG